MSTFIILALIAVNIAQFLNALDLQAQLYRPMSECTQDILDEFSFRLGVTPTSLAEGRENTLHRRPTPFPKLP